MLYADQLNEAVQAMYKKGMYNQLVFYIEACESGSMFPELSKNIGVAAMTATDAKQSSWATYCDPHDKVGDIKIGTCLGDLFSVNWMEDSEAHDPKTETLEEQYKTVKQLTPDSPVQIFGEFDFGNMFVSDFQGVDDGEGEFTNAVKDLLKNIPKYGGQIAEVMDNVYTAKTAGLSHPKTSNVNSRDAKLHYLFHKVSNGGGEKAHKDLKDELDHRMFVDKLFEVTFPKHYGEEKGDEVELTVQPTNFDCLRYLMDSVENNCGRFSDYSLKYVKHLVHVCENQDETGVVQAALKIADFCEAYADVLAPFA